MKYQIKLRKAFLSRETTLDWQLSLQQSIVEAQRRLDWKAATSARVVDETGRDVWRSASGSRRQSLWLWGQATVAALGLAGLVVVGMLEGV
jgi:hypothetical protein